MSFSLPFPYPHTRDQALANALYYMQLSVDDSSGSTVARLHATQATAWATVARALPYTDNVADDQPIAVGVDYAFGAPDQDAPTIAMSKGSYDVLKALAARYVRSSLNHHVTIGQGEMDEDTRLKFEDGGNGSVIVTIQP